MLRDEYRKKNTNIYNIKKKKEESHNYVLLVVDGDRDWPAEHMSC